MKIIQAKKFSNSVKKLHKNQKLQLDEAVRSVASSPEIGELKVGDLADIRVHNSGC